MKNKYTHMEELTCGEFEPPKEHYIPNNSITSSKVSDFYLEPIKEPTQSWESKVKDFWLQNLKGCIYEEHLSKFISNLLAEAESKARKECQEKYEIVANLYNELLMAVGNKYDGETRHQTALRYIKQAETSSLGASRDDIISALSEEGE